MTTSIAADFIGPKDAPTLRIEKVADPVSDTDATSKQWVDTAISSAVTAVSNPYDDSNGWLSGGLVTFVSGSTQFSVSTAVVRYTDYTNEVVPVIHPVVTQGPWTNIDIMYPASNFVRVNLKADGTTRSEWCQ